MIATKLSILVGALFVLLAGVNVWLMFQRLAPGHTGPGAARLTQAHRAAGYLYLAIYLVMMYFMFQRLQDAPEELAPHALVHMLLGLTLAPLLFVKILIARTFKSQSQYLTPLGILLFSLSFVLVGMTVGPEWARRAPLQTVRLESVGLATAQVDLRRAEGLMRARCSLCHNLDRVVGARKDAQGWLATVNRMRALPGSGISEADGREILAYLVKELAVDSSQPSGRQLVGRALVDARCGRCHSLDRVYQATMKPAEWKVTIDRMVRLAPPGYFQAGEARQIFDYLSTPLAKRAASAAALSDPPEGADAAITPPAAGIGLQTDAPAGPSSASDRTAWMVVLGAVSLCSLLYRQRRPRADPRSKAPAAALPSPTLDPPPGANPAALPAQHGGATGVSPAAPASRRRLMLTLARITPETPTVKTFRFLLPEEEAVVHRAGQFLTFDWIVDGQKVVRSYSITSSPSQSRCHLDIAVKRVPDGLVSGYLHDRAAIGMTVSARPPAGRFVLDDPPPRRILAIAAGSGITPMMSILRWMDDACLPIEATLLYSARTADEILFGREMERLAETLPAFRAVVTLTQPSAEWTGERGRVDQDLLLRHCPDLGETVVYLCGPKPFMDATRALLLEGGVAPDRIRQESFGGPPAVRTEPSAAVEPGAACVEFARSGKRAAIPDGCTLLEAAEHHGVAIPYSCRQGQCSTCATRLLAGEVRMDTEDGLDPDLRRQGYILPCVARAQGWVRVDA